MPNKFTDAEILIILAEETMHRALSDCLAREEGTRIRNEAIEWILSDQNNDIMATGAFSFNYVCHLLNLNKNKVRIFLSWQIDSGKNRIREDEYDSFLRLCSNG